jgi:chromosome segregation ATPase
MKVQELQKRIQKLQARRPSLVDEASAAATSLSEARAGLVDATADAGAVTSAHARHNALAAALADLDAQTEQAERDLGAARQEAQREQRLMHIAELATFATRRKAEREKLCLEAERKLAPMLDEIVKVGQDLAQARRAFVAEGRELAPGLLSLKHGADADGSLQRGLDAMLSDLAARGVDLSELLVRRGHSFEWTAIDTDPPRVPEAERTPASRAVDAAVGTYYFRKFENN